MAANRCNQCTLGSCGVVTHGSNHFADQGGLVGGRTPPSYNSERLTASDSAYALNVLRDAAMASDSKGRPLWHIRERAANSIINRIIPNAPITNVNLNNQLDDDKLNLIIEYMYEQRKPTTNPDPVVVIDSSTDIRYQLSESDIAQLTDLDINSATNEKPGTEA